MKTERGLAIVALFVAGLGWGTTGLFVRLIGNLGLSVYELLFVRLLVTGVLILPILAASLIRIQRKIDFRSTGFVGLMMVFYYLGAITAFHNLQLIEAALAIGSSPVLAWVLPLILEKRRPTSTELRQGVGVGLAIAGLLLLVISKSGNQTVLGPEATPWLGFIGAFVAAFITVLNARILNRLGTSAPRPFEITMATVLIGLIIIPCFIPNLAEAIGRVFAIGYANPALFLGFGLFATALPGVAIAYASVHLAPQATSTVSIQLQIWSGVLAWIILGESMGILQIVSAFFVIAGSWLCIILRPT